MDKQKKNTLAELIIIFFIIVVLFSTIFITYINFTKNYKIKSTRENHLTIISIINSEIAECSEESGEWIWNDRVTITCGSIFINDKIDKFFNDKIQLKNPYDKGNAVSEVPSMPRTLNHGINYIMLNKDENRLKVTTSLEYDGKLLETTKHYK
jgi:hypothetical protein